MIEQILEPVDVLASFSGGRIKPRVFLWRKRKFKIENINLAYMARDGRNAIHFFSVTAGTNAYKLSFRPSSMAWELIEVYGD